MATVTSKSPGMARVRPEDLPAHLEDFGAVGNGTVDDTTAFQAAITSGRRVVGRSGATYLVNGGLVGATENQVIDMTGCTVKLKDSASSGLVMRLNGAHSSVIGGVWNLNASNNAALASDPYAVCAVLLGANDTSARNMRIYSSVGIGIKGGTYNRMVAQGNTISDCAEIGIYFDGSDSADLKYNRIIDNFVDVTAAGADGLGIFLTGQADPFTYKQQYWIIRGNTVIGATGNVGITARGIDGIIDANIVQDFDINISADLSSRTVISNNRCEDLTAGTTYQIEVNGGGCTVANNVLVGGAYGVFGSGSFPMDYMVISGNMIENPTAQGIAIQPAVASTARYINIVGNTIFTTGVAVIQGIALTRDCKYATITGNILKGPGSGVTNGKGIYTNAVGGNISVFANRFVGWERPMGVYDASAVAQPNIAFNNNDLTSDIVVGADNYVAIEGSATYGAGVTILNNAVSNGLRQNYTDRLNNITQVWADSLATPEAGYAAGIGSTWTVIYDNAESNMYVKSTGTGNTGWVAL